MAGAPAALTPAGVVHEAALSYAPHRLGVATRSRIPPLLVRSGWTSIVPTRDTTMAQATLKNQQKILSGHRTIVANQKKILRNQERLLLVLANEVIIIRNQEAIIKNQKKILANQAKLGAR
jgi:hypothetical protein